jgi:exopolysaccharide biosynthesis polyprenyl glycosylphosphotransferase
MRRLKQLVLLIGDLLVLVASLFLALCLRQRGIPSAENWSVHIRQFAPSFAVWALVFYIAELYAPERRIGGHPVSARLLGSSAITVLITALMFYLMGAAPITPKTLLALFGAIAMLLLWLWRAAANAISARGSAKTALAFAGCGAAAGELARLVETRPGLGYTARLVYEKDAAVDPGLAPIATRELSDFVRRVDEAGIGLVVLGDARALDAEAKAALFGLLGRPLAFMSLPEFYELTVRRVPVGLIDDLWFLDNIDLRSKRIYEHFKRLLDILLSIAGLVVTSPFWPLTALAIKASSRGPVFFTQKRLGRNGKVFTMIKFRTMRTDLNDFAPTAKGDPRVTGIGRFLRASRIDEIPQLLNILSGDMSFVGPRPERPEIAVELEKGIPFYNQRHLVKPGLTGWDQVSGEYHSPSVEDTKKKLQYDLYYVKNLSPLLDVSIFLKTIMTVLQRVGR